jgi:hypothetical protein
MATRRAGMRRSSIIREATRNLASGTTRATLLTFILVCVASGLILADLLSISQIVQRAEAFHRSGASIEIFTADDRIDGAACDDLAKLPGVRGAGALRKSDGKVFPSVLPGTPIPTGAGSPGLVKLLGGTLQGAGVLAGPEVIGQLGLRAGTALQTASGPVSIGGTYDYPDDGRRGGLRYALVVPVPAAGNFDECWADIWPVDSALTQLIFTTALPGRHPSSQTELSQLNTTMGTSFDASEAVRSRATRLSAIAGAGLGMIIGLWGAFSRRLEMASALHAGVPRRALMAVLLIESGSWLTISGIVSVAVGVVAARHLGDDLRTTVALSSFHIALAVVLGGLAGTCMAFAAIRENQLFSYFKTR